MRKRRLNFGRGALVAAIAAIPILMLLINLQLDAQFNQTRQLAAQINRAQEVRSQLYHALNLHQDMEVGMRGYVLDGDRGFLRRYDRARADLTPALLRLAELGRADPEVAAGPQLSEITRRKLLLMDQVMDLTRTGDRAGAVRVMATGEGEELNAALRSSIALAFERGRAALARRTAESQEARRRMEQTVFGLQIALTLLLVAAAIVIARNFGERQRSVERLGDLSRRQAAIFDAAEDGIITLDGEGVIESLNPAAARMYGYAPVELIGWPAALLFENRPSQAEIRQRLEQVHAGRGGEPGQVLEYSARRRDGSCFPADVALSAVELAEAPLFLAIIRDATFRKQVERMKTDFVATVSHELRTPLTSIAGSLGLLAGGAAGALPEKAGRLVEIARNNCGRLLRLIDDLLDIQKIESGRMEFDMKPLQLAPMLEQTVQANRDFAGDLKVRLELAPVPDDAWVNADHDRMVRVVTNLLSNAVKYSPAGETVRIAVGPADSGWRISVADRGPGIPPEMHARIFERFVQADSSSTRRKGGTGLGLAIVRQIVERHEGTVSFDTAIGQGTAFHVVLPALERRAKTRRRAAKARA